VSSSYTEASRHLIAAALCQGEYRHPLFGRVQPNRPCAMSAALDPARHDGDIKALSRRVSQLEPDQKGLPILIKEYVKLGGQFLGFSVDADFQDAMDGFVVVNLDRTHPKLLSLHMGPENYERFRDWQKPAAARPRAHVVRPTFSALRTPLE
jgi:hypothetical protein